MKLTLSLIICLLPFFKGNFAFSQIKNGKHKYNLYNDKVIKYIEYNFVNDTLQGIAKFYDHKENVNKLCFFKDGLLHGSAYKFYTGTKEIADYEFYYQGKLIVKLEFLNRIVLNQLIYPYTNYSDTISVEISNRKTGSLMSISIKKNESSLLYLSFSRKNKFNFFIIDDAISFSSMNKRDFNFKTFNEAQPATP